MNSSDLSVKFTLNEINKIKNYFESAIKEQDVLIKKLSKFITGFNYTEKILISLNATFGRLNILFHANNNIIAKYVE